MELRNIAHVILFYGNIEGIMIGHSLEMDLVWKISNHVQDRVKSFEHGQILKVKFGRETPCVLFLKRFSLSTSTRISYCYFTWAFVDTITAMSSAY